MREIAALRITETVKQLCIEANCFLPQDMKKCIASAYESESWPQAKEILEQITKNYQIAEKERRPICQDTGLACVFVTIGQDVHIVGDLAEAIHEGVRQGYRDG